MRKISLKKNAHYEKKDYFSVKSYSYPARFKHGKKLSAKSARQRKNKSASENGFSSSEHRLLQLYLREMGSIPLLSSRQEIELAAKIKKCEDSIVSIKRTLGQRLEKDLEQDTEKVLYRLARIINGENTNCINKRTLHELQLLKALLKACYLTSCKHKNIFVKSNLRLVVSISRKYMSRGLPISDLIQEGNVGLIRAVERFDHTKGYKFSTYASWWIHQAISRSILDQSRTIRVPVYILEQASRVRKLNKSMRKENGKIPEPEEISRIVGIPVEAISRVLDATKDILYLDSPVTNGEKATLMDFVENNDYRPDYKCTRNAMINVILDALSTLSSREEEILKMRFGIINDETYTLDEIGKHFSLTRERIRQIEKKALQKLGNSRTGSLLRSFLEHS